MTRKEEAQIIDQARKDRESGEYTEFKPSLEDRISDVVWAPMNLLTGDKSSAVLAEEKQELYHKHRTAP